MTSLICGPLPLASAALYENGQRVGTRYFYDEKDFGDYCRRLMAQKLDPCATRLTWENHHAA